MPTPPPIPTSTLTPASSLRLRQARPSDAAALLSIYRPYVEAPGVCFELACPSLREFEQRIRRALQHWDWQVAEADGRVLGYAYGGLHRERPAYRFSCEVSAYVDGAAIGAGIGGRLYKALLPRLAARGYFNALAVIVQPNPASEAFHAQQGFLPAAVFRQAGYKQGRWWDVAWMQKRLREGVPTELG